MGKDCIYVYRQIKTRHIITSQGNKESTAALVTLAEEIAKSAIPEGSRKINGKYIQSHLLSRLEAVHVKLEEQIKDVDVAQSKEVHLFWTGMAEGSRARIFVVCWQFCFVHNLMLSIYFYTVDGLRLCASVRCFESCIKANPNAFSEDVLEEKEVEKEEKPTQEYKIRLPLWVKKSKT
ncbi:protein PTST, chloroplastic [Fagus crenata]